MYCLKKCWAGGFASADKITSASSHDRMQRCKRERLGFPYYSLADITESSRSCRSSISYATRRDSEKHIRSHSIGGGSVDSKTTGRSHTKSRFKDGKSNNRNGRDFDINKSPACSTQCKLQGDSRSASRTNGAADLTGEILRSERRTTNLTKDLLVNRPASMSQAVGATGPEAANEMRRAILCLLMYSHREFMARSQLPDVLRHNSKPPPDEVEKHLELPPGTLSCQLANYLLHPAVSGQRSGVTTSNAPQNCDTLNLPWPSTHGGGGCCYHLHKPPPPPRAFSMRAKLQQLKQRLTNRPPTAPISCPAAQTPASAAAGLVKSQRQKWISSTAQGSQQAPQANQVATAPARMNGTSLLMQHGNQSGGVPLPPLGVQKPPAQQLLPYTIDGGAVTPKARAHPVAVNPSRSSGPDKTNQNRPSAISHSPDMVRIAANRSAANHPITISQAEPHNGAREKSKSITERDVGTVAPALAWSGEEAIPSEQDLSLPEPKSPFYPPRNNTAGTKMPLVFPPCSSWTPIEPPATAPSIPLSVLQAALGLNGRLSVSTPNSGNQPPKRQLPVHIQPPPLSGAAVPTKSQGQLMQQRDIVNQQLHQHYFELQHPQGSLQAAPNSDELSALQLKAPENALGVFERPAEPAGSHNQAGDSLSAEYLPSARGSRTLPGDAGWNTVNYQPNGDLGPWQFAGLL